MSDPQARKVSPGGRLAGAARALIIATLMAWPPVSTEAQTLSTGVIVGGVTDERGDPLNAVTVTFINRANGQRILARSDRAGFFGSDLLAPGHYDALFERLGFRPHRVQDIVVVAGTSSDVRATLEALADDMTTASTSPAPVVRSFGGATGPDRFTVGEPVASMPLEGRGLAAVLATSSLAGPRREIEGLPGTFSNIVVDGVPFVRRPRGFDVLALDLAVPLYAITQTGLVTNDPDVEYPGSPASVTGHTRRGGRDRLLEGFGDFGTDATASGTGTSPAFTSYRAGVLASGSIVTDTASFLAGGEILRSRNPFDAFWMDAPAVASLAQTADALYGADLTGFTQPALAVIDRESAFGRLDVRLSESTSINALGIYSAISEPEPVAPWTERHVGSTITPRLRNILTRASIVTRIDDDLMTQIDAGFESSQSSSRPQESRDQALPRTTVVEAGHEFGSDRSTDYLGELLSFYLRGTLHIRSGSHWRKLGLSAELPSYKIPFDQGRNGEFVYASVEDFEDGFGFYRAIEGPSERAEFSLRRVSVLAQDTWRPSPSVELLIGARISSFRLPDSNQVALEPTWVNLVGQSNRAFPGRKLEFEPRFAVTVLPAGRQSLRMYGGVMIDSHIADPDVIAEVISNRGLLQVRSGLGNTSAWPDEPTGSTILLRREMLSVIGPDFRGPRSTRAFGSISQTIGEAALSIGVTYRRTEFLPQRTDLNLLPGVAARDQHGRPIFGELRKTAGLLTADYGSNRRFGEFEQVWGLTATGESKYTAFTVSAERPLAGPIGFFGSYTYSKTEDDWLIGRNGDPFTQLAPFPDSIGPENWITGASDLDVPHRAVAGLELEMDGGSFTPRLAGLLRFQSGYPFTPGFRPGVDANADGSGYNDPAFIDESIPGTTDTMSEWPCLRESIGEFAGRNSCRGPDIVALDARLSVTVRREAQYTAAIVLDGVNLIATDAGEVDRALYLVDPAAALGTPTAGRVDIPLVINPDFGTLLTRYTPQRLLRVGVRVSF